MKSHELENLRRSVAMAGLSREQAIRLLDQLDKVQADLDRLRAGLRRLLDESDQRPERIETRPSQVAAHVVE